MSPETQENKPQDTASINYFDLSFTLQFLQSARDIAKNIKGGLASKKKVALTVNGLLQLFSDYNKAVVVKIDEANKMINSLAQQVDDLTAEKAAMNKSTKESTLPPKA